MLKDEIFVISLLHFLINLVVVISLDYKLLIFW